MTAGEPTEAEVPRALIALLAGGAGVSAASLYYNQPILGVIAHDLGVQPAAVGLVPTLTQLGYATGLFLFAPLGDRLDRRRVIVVKAGALAVALLVAGLSPTVGVLCAASLAIGLTATVAQDFVPAAAALAPARSRGATVGKVMTGLLLGILLSRVVSGFVSERTSWRAVFLGAAAVAATLAGVSAVRLPSFAPSTRDSYGNLLRSILTLARTIAPLQRAALAQGLLSVAFSGFWSTLALALAAPPFGLGSTAAGAFGIAGAAGAVIAPVAGRQSDRRGPAWVIQIGASLVVGSFALMALWPGSLLLLVLATVVFDLGVQACLIAHQTIIYGLAPEARSRLNAVLVSVMFVGMALGSALASQVLTRYGWRGVCVQGALAACAALVVRLWPPRAAVAG